MLFSTRLKIITILKILSFTINGLCILNLLTAQLIYFRICGVVLGLALFITYLFQWLDHMQMMELSANPEPKDEN